MSIQNKVKNYCKRHDITVHDNSEGRDKYEIIIETPKGIRLKGMNQHSAVTSFYPLPGETKEDAWIYVWEDLSYGLEECDEPNCGYCERGLQNI